MGNGNDAMNALTAFGSNFLKAKDKKEDERKDEAKWQAQLAVSVGHLNIAKQSEARQAEEFQASIAEKKRVIAAKGQEDANQLYMQALEQDHDPVQAHGYAAKATGYTPQMSPQEGAMWQTTQRAAKLAEHNSMLRSSEASSDRASARAAAAQEAAMRRAAIESAYLNNYMPLETSGQLPAGGAYKLAHGVAGGNIPPELSDAIGKLQQQMAMGKDFDPGPVQNLVKDGVISPGKGAAVIAGYKSGSITPEQDTEITNLINQNTEVVRLRGEAQSLMKDYEVSPEIQAAVAEDKTGQQAKDFLANMREYGAKKKITQADVGNAQDLYNNRLNPAVAKGGPGAVIDAYAGAGPKPNPEAALNLLRLGLPGDVIADASTDDNKYVAGIGAAAGIRDKEKAENKYMDFAKFANYTPQMVAQGMNDPKVGQQQIATTGAGFNVARPEDPQDILSNFKMFANLARLDPQTTALGLNDLTGQTAKGIMGMTADGWKPGQTAVAGTSRDPMGDLQALQTKYGASAAEALDALNDPSGAKKAAIIARGPKVQAGSNEEQHVYSRHKDLLAAGVPPAIAQAAATSNKASMEMLGFYNKGGKNALQTASAESGWYENLQKNYVNPNFVDMDVQTDIVTGKKTAVPSVDPASGEYKWKATPQGQQARANYNKLLLERIKNSETVAGSAGN